MKKRILLKTLSLAEDASLVVVASKDQYEVVKNNDNLQNLSSLEFTILSETEVLTLQKLPEGTKNLVLKLAS